MSRNSTEAFAARDVERMIALADPDKRAEAFTIASVYVVRDGRIALLAPSLISARRHASLG